MCCMSPEMQKIFSIIFKPGDGKICKSSWVFQGRIRWCKKSFTLETSFWSVSESVTLPSPGNLCGVVSVQIRWTSGSFPERRWRLITMLMCVLSEGFLSLKLGVGEKLSMFTQSLVSHENVDSSISFTFWGDHWPGMFSCQQTVVNPYWTDNRLNLYSYCTDCIFSSGLSAVLFWASGFCLCCQTLKSQATHLNKIIT